MRSIPVWMVGILLFGMKMALCEVFLPGSQEILFTTGNQVELAHQRAGLTGFQWSKIYPGMQAVGWVAV